jgi:hypothetical protein
VLHVPDGIDDRQTTHASARNDNCLDEAEARHGLL